MNPVYKNDRKIFFDTKILRLVPIKSLKNKRAVRVHFDNKMRGFDSGPLFKTFIAMILKALLLNKSPSK